MIDTKKRIPFISFLLLLSPSLTLSGMIGQGNIGITQPPMKFEGVNPGNPFAAPYPPSCIPGRQYPGHAFGLQPNPFLSNNNLVPPHTLGPGRTREYNLFLVDRKGKIIANNPSFTVSFPTDLNGNIQGSTGPFQVLTKRYFRDRERRVSFTQKLKECKRKKVSSSVTRQPKKKKEYRCPIKGCNEVCSGYTGLKQHLLSKAHHSEPTVQCKICGHPTFGKASMHYHLKVKHGIEKVFYNKLEMTPAAKRFMENKMKEHRKKNKKQPSSAVGSTFKL